MLSSGYKKDIGNLGENLAENFLKKNNYKILERNYIGRHGEVDLIAFDEKSQEVVFVEVKTRASFVYGKPEESVDFRKKNSLKNTAEKYLMFKNFSWQQNYRFDILAIELNFDTRQAKIRHFKYV